MGSCKNMLEGNKHPPTQRKTPPNTEKGNLPKTHWPEFKLMLKSFWQYSSAYKSMLHQDPKTINLDLDILMSNEIKLK